MTAHPMLRLQNVGKRYPGGVDAVIDLNLEAQPGEFMFVLGPSGSGKTTTLRMIAGFGAPSSGRIELNGQPIADLPAHRRDIGMVFQRYALFPHLTVADNVAFGLKMRGMPERERPKRVGETLALVRLDGLEKRYPHQLSGGQQQRVALARALAYRPSLLLLDEPLANLDRRLRDEMRIELKRIQQEMGTTMLFVTHDQEEALTLGDRIAVMNQGRIEQVGSPVEIYRHPATEFVASFIGDMSFLPGTVEQPGPAADSTFVRLDIGGPLQPVSGRFADRSRVLVYIRPERVALRAAEPGARTGVVRYAGFSGDAIRYVVAVDDCAAQVLSRQPADAAAQRFTVGSRVAIGLGEGALCAFPL